MQRLVLWHWISFVEVTVAHHDLSSLFPLTYHIFLSITEAEDEDSGEPKAKVAKSGSQFFQSRVISAKNTGLVPQAFTPPMKARQPSTNVETLIFNFLWHLGIGCGYYLTGKGIGLKGFAEGTETLTLNGVDHANPLPVDKNYTFQFMKNNCDMAISMAVANGFKEADLCFPQCLRQATRISNVFVGLTCGSSEIVSSNDGQDEWNVRTNSLKELLLANPQMPSKSPFVGSYNILVQDVNVSEGDMMTLIWMREFQKTKVPLLNSATKTEKAEFELHHGDLAQISPVRSSGSSSSSSSSSNSSSSSSGSSKK